MATVSVTLNEGLTIGKKQHLVAVLREPTAADILEAAEESEKVVMVGSEPTLVASPALMGANTLCRQIVKIGDYQGPIELSELKKLSAVDLALLQEEASKLDQAMMKDLVKRGRADAGGEGDPAAG